MPELHSTGRGGAGNIGKDPVVYTDGSIVREGEAGKPAGPGEYSTGRGGAGNVVPGEGAKTGPLRDDADVVPEPAMVEKHQEVFHTGRGGQGNVHKDKYGGHSKPQSAEHMEKYHGGATSGEEDKKEHHGLGDKVKNLFHKK